MRHLILPTLFLAGCGSPLTRAEFEHYHPWCSPMEVIPASPANDMVATLVYPDRIPGITPSVYSWRSGIHILRVNQEGLVLYRTWQDNDTLGEH